MQKDPFLIFLSDLSKKIALEKEHKQIMEKIDSTETTEPLSESPLEGFISTLKEKLINTVPEPIIVNEEVTKQESVEDIIKRDLKDVIIETTEEKENPFTSFVNRLKDIIEKGPTTETTSTSSAPVKSEQQQIPVINSTKVEKKDKSLEPTNPNEYVNELEKIKNSIAIEKEDDKVVEIKKLIEEYAEKYIKKAVGMMGESGGGTNAVQYANGGTMNGDLNVNGNYLSGGVNLLDIFVTSDSDNQTLTYNDTNYDLSISSGNTVNLSSINTTFNANSGKYESVYTTVNSLSDSWEESADIIPTITNYLSTNNVLLLSATVMDSLSVGGTIYTTVTSEAVLKYTQNIGNNISSSFNIVHNFNTKDIAISVYDNSTNIQSYPEINVIDNNYIKVNFAFIPSVNAYRVLIIGTKPSNLIAAYGNTSYVTAIEKYQFKNSNFNILSGYYAVDTSSGPVKGILPPTPSLGDTLVFIDTYTTWATYNFVIENNGNPIDSLVDDLSANINGFAFRLTWIGNPVGWNIY